MRVEGPTAWPEGFADGPRNRDALLVLSCLRGLTPRRLLALADRKRTAAACLNEVIGGRSGSEADSTFARECDPKELASAISACGARLVAVGSSEYPPGMLDLADPPAALFVRGLDLTDLLPGVAVIGARACSALGRDVARSIGRGLAEAGIAVVSGAARGIDSASHEGALLAPGPRTVAFLGSGIDVAYPKRNVDLLARIERTGAIVSEYAPGVPAEPYRFPARNRLIAAASRAVVVVEGAAGSGTLITCEQATEIGRQVFAVPGPVNSPLSDVPLELIRDGSPLVRDADDLLRQLGLDGGAAGQIALARLSLIEEQVYAHVAGPTLPEHVAREMHLTVTDVLPVLMQLELRGIVRAVGGRFERRIGA